MLVLLMVVHHHFHFFFFLSLIECLSAGPVSHSIPVKDYQSSFFKVDFGCGGGRCDTL